MLSSLALYFVTVMLLAISSIWYLDFPIMLSITWNYEPNKTLLFKLLLSQSILSQQQGDKLRQKGCGHGTALEGRNKGSLSKLASVARLVGKLWICLIVPTSKGIVNEL